MVTREVWGEDIGRGWKVAVEGGGFRRIRRDIGGGGGSWLGYKVGGRRQKGNPSISICCIFCMRCVSISKIFPMHHPYVCCGNEWSNSRDENWCDTRGKHWVAENLARVSPVVGSIFKMKKAVGTVGTKGIIILKANVATKKHLVPKASCHLNM